MAGRGYMHVNIKGEAMTRAAQESGCIVLKQEHDARQHMDTVWLYAPTQTVWTLYVQLYCVYAEEAWDTVIHNYQALPRQEFIGWRFFVVYPTSFQRTMDTRRQNAADGTLFPRSMGVVLAVYEGRVTAQSMYESAIGPRYLALATHNETDLCWVNYVSKRLLRERCRAVTLHEAMRLHPHLFLENAFFQKLEV